MLLMLYALDQLRLTISWNIFGHMKKPHISLTIIHSIWWYGIFLHQCDWCLNLCRTPLPTADLVKYSLKATGIVQWL